MFGSRHPRQKIFSLTWQRQPDAEDKKAAEATVANFAAAPGHECFEAFRIEMSVYVQDGRVDTIQQAWDLTVACEA